MVYYGPSSGCQMCRRRKIKCDENDPCQNCLRRQLPCSGPSRLPRTQKPQSGPRTPSFTLNAMEINALVDELRNPSESLESSTVQTDSLCISDRNGDGMGNGSYRSRSAANSDHGHKLHLTPQPTISWKDISVTEYLSFIRSDPDEVNPWLTLAVDTSNRIDQAPEYPNDALAAVSLQWLSREPRLAGLRSQAAAYHGRALRALNGALADANQATSDVTLVGIRLFIVYGFKVENRGNQSASRYNQSSEDFSDLGDARSSAGTGPLASSSSRNPTPPETGMAAVRTHNPGCAVVDPHFDGLLRLLLIRGPEQLQKQSSRMLYLSIRERIIYNYSARCQCLPVSKAVPKWQWFFDSPVTTTADALTNIASDIPLTRYRAAILYNEANGMCRLHSSKDIKNDAYILMSRLRTWHSQLPAEWRVPRVVTLTATGNEPRDMYEHEGPGHLYPKPSMALVIGLYQAYQIMMSQVICICLEEEIARSELIDQSYYNCILEQERENACAEQRALVNSICAILAVYNVQDKAVYELGYEIPPDGLQYGGHFIPPILTAKSVQSVPSKQMRFLGQKMKEFLGSC